MATRVVQTIFDNEIRICSECHCHLPKDYTDEVCPTCKERLLFSKVKDFIRENDVTEFDVAEEFQIPRSRVRGWIREGRIQYKELQHEEKMETLHCQQCGEAIAFGSLCSKCLRKSNISGNAIFSSQEEEERFRFLQK